MPLSPRPQCGQINANFARKQLRVCVYYSIAVFEYQCSISFSTKDLLRVVERTMSINSNMQINLRTLFASAPGFLRHVQAARYIKVSIVTEPSHHFASVCHCYGGILFSV